MSEEEAIKEIENYLDYEGSVSIQAIATLYTLYNKEKEENRIMKAEFERLENIEDDTAQLKLLLKEEKEKNKGLNAILTLVNIGLENYISKDKIREIKKELDERIQLRDDDTYNKFKYLTIGEAIMITRFIEKELLGDDTDE